MSSIETQTGESQNQLETVEPKRNLLTPTTEKRARKVSSSSRNSPNLDSFKPQKFKQVTKLSKADQIRLGDAFKSLSEIDAGDHKDIAFLDVKKCINSMGIAYADDRILKHCEKNGEDGEMKMNYRSFEKCFNEVIKAQQISPHQVTKFYKQIDCLKEGHVSFDALRSWCYSNDIVLPEDELKLMVATADFDKDGFITEKEFMKLMQDNSVCRPNSKKK